MVEQGKAWFDSIRDTPLKDRIFVLMLFIIFILVFTNVTTANYFRDRENLAAQERDKAQEKAEALREVIIRDNKDYSLVMANERRECDEKWRDKFDNEREFNKKLLEDRAKFSEDRAKRFEEQLITLTKESQRIRNEASRIKEKVKL